MFWQTDQDKERACVLYFFYFFEISKNFVELKITGHLEFFPCWKDQGVKAARNSKTVVFNRNQSVKKIIEYYSILNFFDHERVFLFSDDCDFHI